MERNWSTIIKEYIYRTSVGVKNKLKYAKHGPEFGELIYINPQNINTFLPVAHRSSSGLILGGDWDLEEKKNIENTIIYNACRNHWVNNVPWEELDIYQYMLDKIQRFGGRVDGCSNLDDIISRYIKLDVLFEEIKTTRNFKTQKELNKYSFNEHGGLLFHIDRNNNPIYGGGGMHRFAIAKILNLELIPAQLGVVHVNAIKSWKLHKKNTI
jgi:hypothetical protein